MARRRTPSGSSSAGATPAGDPLGPAADTAHEDDGRDGDRDGDGVGDDAKKGGKAGNGCRREAGGRAAARKARRKRNRRRKIVVPLVVVGSLLLLTGVAGAYVAYRKLNGNIRTDAVEGKLSEERPEVGGSGKGTPLNVVIIGSDSRAGANRQLGGGRDEGERSDTTLLLHLTSDRKRAVVLSIPRDLMVTVPPCVLRDGSKSPERTRQMFNSAYELAGAACTRNTIERLTGIRVDHHIIVDFSGFKDMVDAVGGVEICLPRAVTDRTGRISLAAGKRTVHGKEALDFVRLRHDESLGGNGSDLGRIKRQQAFIASLAKEMTSNKVLFNPARMFNLADALTKSIRADEGLASVKALVDLGRTVQGIKTSDMKFVTVPVYDSPTDKYRLDLIQPDARRLFQAVNADEPLDGRKPAAAPAPGTAGAADSAVPAGDAGTPGVGTPVAAPTRHGTPGGPSAAAPVPGAPGSPSTASTAPGSAGSPEPPGVVPPGLAPSQVHVKVLNGSDKPGAAREVRDELVRRGFVVESTGTAAAPVRTTTIAHPPALADQAQALAAALPGAAVETRGGAPRQVVLTIGSSYTGMPPAAAPPPAAPRPASTAPPPPLKVATRDADQDICTVT